MSSIPNQWLLDDSSGASYSTTAELSAHISATTIDHPDGSVTEPKLDITNTWASGYYLTMNGGGRFAWSYASVPMPGSSGQFLFNRAGVLSASGNLSSYPDNGIQIRPPTVFSAFRTTAVGSATGADNGVYTEITSSVNAGVFNVFNGTAVLSRIYLGWENCLPRQLRSYNNGGASGVTGVVLWEIWNGSAWATITGNNLTADGGNITIPTTATSKTTINGVSAYWIRATVSTGYTVAPQFRFLRNPQASNLPADANPAMYTTGFFVAPSSTTQGIINTVIGGGSGATALFSGITYGNGEQNIMQIYSSLGGAVLFSIGGDGTISAGSADNTFRNLTLNGGASNQTAILTTGTGVKSQTAWGAAGALINVQSTTRTDSSTAVSGTATIATFTSLRRPTLGATNATVTTTTASTFYVENAPLAGTNMTITEALAIHVGAGRSRFGGEIATAGVMSAVTTKTGAYSAVATDQIILCNTTTAGFTITLPTAVGRAGQTYTIKKISSDANTLTVGTTGGQTIDGTATVTTTTQWARWTVVSDGANWMVVA